MLMLFILNIIVVAFNSTTGSDALAMYSTKGTFMCVCLQVQILRLLILNFFLLTARQYLNRKQLKTRNQI